MKDAQLEEARQLALRRYRRILTARRNLEDAGDGTPSLAEVLATVRRLEREAFAAFEWLDLQSLPSSE